MLSWTGLLVWSVAPINALFELLLRLTVAKLQEALLRLLAVNAKSAAAVDARSNVPASARVLRPIHRRVVSPNSIQLGDAMAILCLCKVWAIVKFTNRAQ